MKRTILFFLFVNFYCTSYAQFVWQSVGNGLGTDASNSCRTLLNDTMNNFLYAAGIFKDVDTFECEGIAFWNSSIWASNVPYPNGASGLPHIQSLGLYNEVIYGCGGTTNGSIFHITVSGLVADCIANGLVYSFCVYHNKLYAGGDFTIIDGIPAKCLASYDGTNWSEVGGGVDWTQACCADVRALHVWNDKLYVGGTFDKAGNLDSTNSIACWNDTSWSRLGTGLLQPAPVPQAYVYAIEDFNDEIYVGGIINQSGAIPVNGICRWMNGAWYDVGGGLDGVLPKVNCLLNKDGYLFIGGLFSSAGGVSITQSLCKWDGVNLSSAWGDLHSGGQVFCMAEYNDELYIGGNFPMVGLSLARNIAKYGLINSVNEVNEREFSLYPNPAQNQVTVSELKQGDKIEVSDITGRVLIQTTESIIDVTYLSSGIYLLEIKTKDGKRAVKKFVKE